MRASIAHLRAAGGGSIIDICSYAGMLAVADVAAYSTSKSAVTKQAALDLGRDGVRVNVISPRWSRAGDERGAHGHARRDARN